MEYDRKKWQTLLSDAEKRRSRYRKQVSNATKRIKQLKVNLKKSEKMHSLLHKVNRDVFFFTKIWVYNSYANKHKKYIRARQLFYKHGIDSGVNALMLSKFTGAKRYTANDSRIKLNRSLITNSEAKDMWESFKQSLKQ